MIHIHSCFLRSRKRIRLLKAKPRTRSNLMRGRPVADTLGDGLFLESVGNRELQSSSIIAARWTTTSSEPKDTLRQRNEMIFLISSFVCLARSRFLSPVRRHASMVSLSSPLAAHAPDRCHCSQYLPSAPRWERIQTKP